MLLWIDGKNDQLKLITSKEHLDFEEKYKVTNYKHSSTRTVVVEQPTYVGPTFK